MAALLCQASCAGRGISNPFALLTLLVAFPPSASASRSRKPRRDTSRRYCTGPAPLPGHQVPRSFVTMPQPITRPSQLQLVSAPWPAPSPSPLLHPPLFLLTCLPPSSSPQPGSSRLAACPSGPLAIHICVSHADHLTCVHLCPPTLLGHSVFPFSSSPCLHPALLSVPPPQTLWSRLHLVCVPCPHPKLLHLSWQPDVGVGAGGGQSAQGSECLLRLWLHSFPGGAASEAASFLAHPLPVYCSLQLSPPVFAASLPLSP